MIDLSGRHVLVTGGSRGIGAACCRYFAAVGAAVAVHYHRNAEAARQVLANLPAVAHAEHWSQAAELDDPAQVEKLFSAVEERWGALDCLVNNAGIWVHNPIAELDSAKLEETIRVNVTGPFLCASAAVPLLRQSVDGNIVNITSTAGQRGEAHYSPYAASKGAMISATKAWSTELAPGIRVNSVAPGWVDTEMCAVPFAGDGKEKIAATIPLGRVAGPEDIAGPVLFLASALAHHITGEILNVNGGSVLVG